MMKGSCRRLGPANDSARRGGRAVSYPYLAGGLGCTPDQGSRFSFAFQDTVSLAKVNCILSPSTLYV